MLTLAAGRVAWERPCLARPSSSSKTAPPFAVRRSPAHGAVGGELVFNTSMAGYQEIATDPSYCGQLVTYTFPMNGNYGADPARDESDKAHARAIIAREITNYRFNRASRATWLDWLAEHGVLAVSGVDTRALTRHIREQGRAARRGQHRDRGREAPAQGRPGAAQDGRPRSGAASSPAQRVRGAGARRGPGARPPRRRLRLRHQALDAPLPRGARLSRHRRAGADQRPRGPQAGARRRVPQQRARRPGRGRLRASRRSSGCSARCRSSASASATSCSRRRSASSTYKLKFGHRGANHPVKDLRTGVVEITTQNHGFAVRDGRGRGRRRDHARQPQRRHGRGRGRAGALRLLGAVPPRVDARAARLALPVRPLPRARSAASRRRGA